jgi:hypothetical protein
LFPFSAWTRGFSPFCVFPLICACVCSCPSAVFWFDNSSFTVRSYGLYRFSLLHCRTRLFLSAPSVLQFARGFVFFPLLAYSFISFPPIGFVRVLAGSLVFDSASLSCCFCEHFCVRLLLMYVSVFCWRLGRLTSRLVPCFSTCVGFCWHSSVSRHLVSLGALWTCSVFEPLVRSGGEMS